LQGYTGVAHCCGVNLYVFAVTPNGDLKHIKNIGTDLDFLLPSSLIIAKDKKLYVELFISFDYFLAHIPPDFLFLNTFSLTATK